MNPTRRSPLPRGLLFALLLMGCASTPPAEPPMGRATPDPEQRVSLLGPSPEEASAFVDSAEAVLYRLATRAGRAAWVQANFITHDTEILAAEANEEYLAAAVRLAKEAARFQHTRAAPDVQRRLHLLRTSLTTPAPSEPAKTAEVARLSASLESQYGSGKFCPPGKSADQCLDLGELSRILATSRNPDSLQMAWVGWRTISPPMRDEYRRFVELTNEGAKELGFADSGALWRSQYDMSPEEFAREVERLWEQVRPLYEDLHCHVRAQLVKQYGPGVVPPEGPIPAHLLGNMWAQEWGTIYPLIAPTGGGQDYNLTTLLKEKGYTPEKMVRTGESFFTSLGLEPLPKSFYERSLFTKPRDREVVCHASAWDLEPGDLRIKMCIEVTAEDFQTIHHELGHNFYQRAYRNQPYLFRGSANDAFHEALGDAVALSITPSYLVRLGILAKEPPASQDRALLLRDALDKVAFLPFGLLVDQWRWKVFSGEISPEEFNQSWWELRRKYQGISPPTVRTEEHFDPGAKYHIPANVPYTRYFLARILQYQFHRSLCQAAGYQGPLNRCSIYGNREAGQRLQEMMALGSSRPWPEALEALTGSREMDATAMLDYFAPLHVWLKEQNRGRKCGW